MLSPKHLSAIGLVLLALIFAGANLWLAAARSTIPLALDTTVLRKETRHEKHPPKDDVCLLHTSSQGTLHVDQEVFDAVTPGERLHKAAWSRQLLRGDQPMALEYSADFRGMLFVMPIFVLVVVTVSAIPLWLGRTSLQTQAKQT